MQFNIIPILPRLEFVNGNHPTLSLMRRVLTQLCINTRVCIFLIPLFTMAACAMTTTIDIKDTSTTPNTFTPLTDSPPDRAPAAYLRNIRVLSREVESGPSESFLMNLRNSLAKSNWFSEVGYQSTPNREVVRFDITLTEEKDDHMLTNLPKVVLVGGTLGLLSPILPLYFDYHYTLEVEASLLKGESKRYAVQTDAAMTSHFFGFEQGVKNLNRTTLDKTLDAWLSQMVKDAKFYTASSMVDPTSTTRITQVLEAVDKERYTLTPTVDFGTPSGVYIPMDLEDSFSELKKMMHPSFLEEFKGTPEDRLGIYQSGLGKWLRNNWRLWKGSRLSEYFNRLGIQHPDDMSRIILFSFYRSLRQLPLQLDDQVQFYQAHWNKVRERERSAK